MNPYLSVESLHKYDTLLFVSLPGTKGSKITLFHKEEDAA